MLSKDIFIFLKALTVHNNREWFKKHITTFRTAESNVKLFYSQLYDQLNNVDSIDNFKVFRIYRDVRFSKDKTPYKTHFSGSFHRTKPELRGGYYLHLAPNNKSFIATGFWNPNKEDLFRLRKEFEIDSQDLRAIIAEPRFKAVWGTLEGDELRSAPQGFNKQDQNIDLIRKKQFIFSKKYTDKEVLSEQFTQDVIDSFKAIRPYFDYISSVLTTNLNGESII
jgi:uncharacterized protein (TIGR02453 family)|tara:strand:+ start:654 stop:1322 length:669 start_codon:yes stop_codon:yes gene_type:complete